MSEDPDRPPAPPPGEAIPVPASTVVVLRPGPGGPEVLMVGRAPGGYVPGDWVFPGGRVDPADGPPAPPSGSFPPCGPPPAPGGPPRGRGFCLAALRELSEESGLLLARDRFGRLVDGGTAAAVRAAAEAGAGAWHAALAERGLVPATDLLAPLARWVTPSSLPRRFDTFFFAARAPEGQQASPGHEVKRLKWIRPADAVAENASGGPTSLPPPTLDTMLSLADAFAAAPAGDGSWLDALLAAWARRGVPPDRRPFLAMQDEGPMVVLPGDPLHPDTPGADPAARDRFVLREGRFHRVRTP